MIGRKKKQREAEEIDQAVDAIERAEEDSLREQAAPAETDRSRGPWDVAEIEGDDDRLDLGGIRVRGAEGMQMQVQMDEATGVVTMVTLSMGGGAVQIQPFAAPRKAGIWDDIRAQLITSINQAGGLVEEAAGDFGPELRARVPGQGGQLQPARFVGIDGPRWFLRGLFLGAAAQPGAVPDLEHVFRDTVVVRGDEAMAPGDNIPMSLPANAEATPAPPDSPSASS